MMKTVILIQIQRNCERRSGKIVRATEWTFLEKHRYAYLTYLNLHLSI